MNGRRQGTISLEWEKHGKKTLFPLNPSLYSGFLNGGDEEWFLLISHHLEVTGPRVEEKLWKNAVEAVKLRINFKGNREEETYRRACREFVSSHAHREEEINHGLDFFELWVIRSLKKKPSYPSGKAMPFHCFAPRAKGDKGAARLAILDARWFPEAMQPRPTPEARLGAPHARL
ncbi:hypothetical protein ZIOFF_024086 [Zingiber officinale]|uniref:Uncharacterized protein n=1 Tax=Zingiber officinale TaxID=94328 RepID=A0A8J5L612_ZINOF|nr:hypothetical protein ZIOFF_024086 [Zingiber officinale]